MSYFLTRDEKIKLFEIRKNLDDIKKRLAIIESIGSCRVSVVPFDEKQVSVSWSQVVALCREIIKLTGVDDVKKQ